MPQAGFRFRRFRLQFGLVALVLVVGFMGSLAAQDAKPADTPASPTSKSDTASPDTQSNDPLKRPISDKQKKENAKALKQELGKTYKKWLNEDVLLHHYG